MSYPTYEQHRWVWRIIPIPYSLFLSTVGGYRRRKLISKICVGYWPQANNQILSLYREGAFVTTFYFMLCPPYPRRRRGYICFWLAKNKYKAGDYMGFFHRNSTQHMLLYTYSSISVLKKAKQTLTHGVAIMPVRGHRRVRRFKPMLNRILLQVNAKSTF